MYDEVRLSANPEQASWNSFRARMRRVRIWEDGRARIWNAQLKSCICRTRTSVPWRASRARQRPCPDTACGRKISADLSYSLGISFTTSC
jgi:hypothetical protein